MGGNIRNTWFKNKKCLYSNSYVKIYKILHLKWMFEKETALLLNLRHLSLKEEAKIQKSFKIQHW